MQACLPETNVRHDLGAILESMRSICWTDGCWYIPAHAHAFLLPPTGGPTSRTGCLPDKKQIGDVKRLFWRRTECQLGETINECFGVSSCIRSCRKTTPAVAVRAKDAIYTGLATRPDVSFPSICSASRRGVRKAAGGRTRTNSREKHDHSIEDKLSLCSCMIVLEPLPLSATYPHCQATSGT